MSDAGLRGLGGAGFPTGRKWSLVRAEPAPRLMAVNADEGEPGTFKDRYYLERDPHRFIEGMLIAAWVVEAPEIYVYVRDEYPGARLMLAEEIAKVSHRRGLARITRRRRLRLRRRRVRDDRVDRGQARPAAAPPAYVAQVGLFGRPTLEQNVETLLGARHRGEGAAWFTCAAAASARARSFSVSGRVNKPRAWTRPAHRRER